MVLHVDLTRVAEIVARVRLADMGRVGAAPLIRISTELEIVIAKPIRCQQLVVLNGRSDEGGTAFPTTDQARSEQLPIDTKGLCLGIKELVEIVDRLFQFAEDHEGAVLHPSDRRLLHRSWKCTVGAAADLPFPPKDELS